MRARAKAQKTTAETKETISIHIRDSRRILTSMVQGIAKGIWREPHTR
jgi:hypothetical protein